MARVISPSQIYTNLLPYGICYSHEYRSIIHEYMIHVSVMKNLDPPLEGQPEAIWALWSVRNGPNISGIQIFHDMW